LIVDEAIEDYFKKEAVLNSSPVETQTVNKETGTFGMDGWSISKSHKAFRDD